MLDLSFKFPTVPSFPWLGTKNVCPLMQGLARGLCNLSVGQRHVPLEWFARDHNAAKGLCTVATCFDKHGVWHDAARIAMCGPRGRIRDNADVKNVRKIIYGPQNVG